MLRRVRDFAQVKGDGTITREMADHALQALEIDYLGLDPVDHRMLRAIIEITAAAPWAWIPWPPPSARSP